MKECHNEDAQCAFIVDKISEILSNHSTDNLSYGNIAILYRRRVMFLDTITIMTMYKSIAPYLYWMVFASSSRLQVSGKAFQMAFRDRKIPFNIHGVAFYRKKVLIFVIKIKNCSFLGILID